MPYCLVTGGGSGIGRLSAIALARAKWTVAIVGRREGQLEQVAEECRTVGGDAYPCAGDISDPIRCAEIFSAIFERFGRLDMLFNNAGVATLGAALEDVTLSDWNASLAVNLTGAFLCTQHAIRIMKRQNPKGGRIINNGSLSAHVPRPLAAPYTVTKHGISGLTRAIALEGRLHDIACTQIDIGNAATDMTAGFDAGMLQADGSIATEPRIDARHIGDLVVHIAGLPLAVSVPNATIMATKMPYIGRG